MELHLRLVVVMIFGELMVEKDDLKMVVGVVDRFVGKSAVRMVVEAVVLILKKISVVVVLVGMRVVVVVERISFDVTAVGVVVVVF